MTFIPSNTSLNHCTFSHQTVNPRVLFFQGSWDYFRQSLKETSSSLSKWSLTLVYINDEWASTDVKQLSMTDFKLRGCPMLNDSGCFTFSFFNLRWWHLPWSSPKNRRHHCNFQSTSSLPIGQNMMTHTKQNLFSVVNASHSYAYIYNLKHTGKTVSILYNNDNAKW